jgi:hypothetical protein
LVPIAKGCGGLDGTHGGTDEKQRIVIDTAPQPLRRRLRLLLTTRSQLPREIACGQVLRFGVSP